MGLKVEGLPKVTQELQRFVAAQRPAIDAALQSATTMGRELAVDSIYRRYGYADRMYVNQHLSVRFNKSGLEARIVGRYRPSTISRFVTNQLTRTGKNGRNVSAGLRVSVLRNQATTWRTAFLFRGRNGNELVSVRYKGEKWRKIKRSMYGPSVAGSFASVRESIEPEIVAHLQKTYQRLIK